MEFLQSPPDTFRFMFWGYVIAVLVMAAYAASLYFRQRRLRRDLQDLEELAGESPSSA
jgi:hypothetical protein